MRIHTNIRGRCQWWEWGGIGMLGRVGRWVGACVSRLNGGHRSVEMRPEEQLTGDLVDHEAPV